MGMKLSVVVPTYDRTEDLVDCLRSLRSQFDPPDEVVIVDDGDTTTTRRRLREAGLTEATHISGKGASLPASRNAGVEVATGDVVCFVDDDVVLPPNWSRQLKRTYERFPGASGVGGYVLNYNPPDINKANMNTLGYRLLSGLRLVLFYDRVGTISPLGILYAPHVLMTADCRRVDALQGCNMSFRAEVFEDHRFDEWYGTAGSSACEELDFCARVSDSGHSLVYDPRLVALHKRSTGDTEAKEERTDPNHASIVNLTRFVLAHPRMGVPNVVLLAVAVAVYSVLTRDPGYLGAVKDGIGAYRRNETRSEPDAGP